MESVLSRGNGRQRSGEDARHEKVPQGYERRHKHSGFTTDQLIWNVEFGVGLGHGFKGKKLKWFFSTSHENTKIRVTKRQRKCLYAMHRPHSVPLDGQVSTHSF